ncbi:MAG: GNAT family N-acetyltransferase [Proteobacteria bacterium]|nr:GNAT family N-acetyltransferase [Pseudomonadota bacterium]MDA0967350.1 GNAT family N-acetyltransferase [Pseudomonadota bacterium]
MENNIIIKPGSSSFSSAAAKLIYESSHELLNFMFKDQETAEKVLAKLYRKNKGHFSNVFSTVVEMEGEIVGLELGYDKGQLAKQDLIGSISLLLNSPFSIWWHLIAKTGRIIDGYVPKPSDRIYYINNIAVSDRCRGKGVGKKLLEYTIEKAKNNGYSAVELDVTSVNENAIGFYKKHGFVEVSKSGSQELMTKYGLPPLIRMVHKL